MTEVPFYLQSFIANTVGGKQPVSEFANGAPIQLSWDSNGTAFTVYAAGDADPVYSGPSTSCVIEAGRTDTTTFILSATVTGGGQSGTPAPGFETVTLYDALTVTISNPDETPRSVGAGTLTVDGATTLKGDTALTTAVIAGTLGVNGATRLDGGLSASALTVNGVSSLQGVSANAATINGSLQVTGSAQLANLTASALSVQSSVAMLNPKGIGPGSYTPSSDGLIAGTAAWPSDPSAKSMTFVWGRGAGGFTAWGVGGNYVSYLNGSGSYTMCNNAGSFVLPVARGVGFAMGVMNVGGGVEAPTSFLWVPFGLNAGLEELSDSEAAAQGLSAPEPPTSGVVPRYDPGPPIEELLEILTEVAGDAIGEDERARFRDALRALTDPGLVVA